MNIAPKPTTKSPLDKVITALRKSGSNGSGSNKAWKFQCPSHVDNNPSLSVSEGDTGTALLRCFAGCKTEDIIATIGLDMSDLFPDNVTTFTPKKKIINTKDYFYPASDGTKAFKKVREDFEDDSKTFWWYHWFGGQWVSKLAGRTAPLYNLPQIITAVQSSKTVHIVEGEKCADALMTLGFTATTSGFGAETDKKLTFDVLEPLTNANVVLWPDNDDPGKKYINTFETKLIGTAKQIKVIKWPANLPAGFDVADLISEGATPADIDLLVSKAEISEETGVFHPVVIEATEYIKMKFPPAEYLFDRMIIRGGLTLLASLPKSGKSTFLRFLVKQLLHGEPLLGYDAQLENPMVTILDFETAPESEFQSFLAAINPPKDTLEIIRYPYALGENPEKRIEQLLFKDKNRTRPIPNVIIIDTIGKFFPDLEDTNKYSEVTRFLTALKSLCNRYSCSIIIAHHNSKGNVLDALPTNKEDAMTRILGSVGWRAAPDCNIVMFKNATDESHVAFYGEQRVGDNSSFVIHTTYDKVSCTYQLGLGGDITEKERKVIEILFEAHEPLTKTYITSQLPKSWGKADKAIASLSTNRKIAAGNYLNPKSNRIDYCYADKRYVHMLQNPTITAAEFAAERVTVEESPSISMTSLNLDEEK
jgi:5S rRNA maturation endonuclease (ribonuclease M5)